LDQLADQSRGQRLVGMEMKGALGPAVALEIPGQSLERRSTKRGVRAALCRRLESRDDPSVEAKRPHPVANALLCSGTDGSDRFSKLIEGAAFVAPDGGQVVVDLRHGTTSYPI